MKLCRGLAECSAYLTSWLNPHFCHRPSLSADSRFFRPANQPFGTCGEIRKALASHPSVAFILSGAFVPDPQFEAITNCNGDDTSSRNNLISQPCVTQQVSRLVLTKRA